MLRLSISELEKRIPMGTPGKGMDANLFDDDSSKAEKLLSDTFRGKEATFVESAKQLLEIEGKEPNVGL